MHLGRSERQRQLAEGRGPYAWRVQKNRPLHQGPHTGKANNLHYVWLWKPEGPNSVCLYNQWDFEHEALKISWLSTEPAMRVSESWATALKVTAACQQRQHKNSNLHNAGEQTGNRSVHTDFKIHWRTSPKMKELTGVIFTPIPQHKHRVNYRMWSYTDTCYLIY